MTAPFSPSATPLRATPTDPHDLLVGARVVDAPPADVALFGLPYDGAVIGRKGARLGPDAIRAQLAKLKASAPARWLDLGNAQMPDDPRAAGDVATAAMQAAMATGAFPLALGGDHSLTHGLVRAVAMAHPGLHVLNLDAHLDVRESPTINSGTSFRRLVDDGLVPGARIANVGMRPYVNSPVYIAWARRQGFTLVPSDAWARGEALPVLGRAIPRDAPLYLSLDIDVLDETAAPGVSAPTPGGPTSSQLLALLHELRTFRIVAMDIVETCPPLDMDNRTARAAAWAALTVAAEHAAREAGHA